MKNAVIRYEAESTLPPSAYTPFLSNTPIERSLEQAKFSPSSKVHITAYGTMNRNNLTEWVAEGQARIENFSYRGSQLHSISGDYTLNPLRSQFTNVKANFDYSNYVLPPQIRRSDLRPNQCFSHYH